MPEVRARASAESIEARLRVTARSETAELVADVAAQFSLRVPAEVSSTGLREFIEAVGVMTLYPYIRESLFSSAARLGEPAPVLELLRQGAFRVGGDADEQTLTPDQLATELGSSAKRVRAILRELDSGHPKNQPWHITAKQAQGVRDAIGTRH